MRQDNRGLRAGQMPRRYFVAKPAPAAWQPNLDVYETGDAVVVVVELAGIQAEPVDISVDGRILLLRGARTPHFLPGYHQFYQLEIPQGSFERTVRLPTAVDGERAEARYRDGFLEIVLPLARPFRPAISSGTGNKESSES